MVVGSLTCQGWTDRDDVDIEFQVSQISVNKWKSRQAYAGISSFKIHLPRGGGGGDRGAGAG